MSYLPNNLVRVHGQERGETKAEESEDRHRLQSDLFEAVCPVAQLRATPGPSKNPHIPQKISDSSETHFATVNQTRGYEQ
jgi:hypothetical protein